MSNLHFPDIKMKTKFAFIIAILSLCISFTATQCITGNDIRSNETSIRTAVSTLIEGNTQFTLNLFRSLNSDSRGNKDSSGIFFSPFSIWSSLIVTYMGSRGPTELEMKHVLGVGDTDKVTVWEAFRNIRNSEQPEPNRWALDYYDSSDRDTQDSFQSANRIYFQQGTSFRDCVKELLEENIAFVDFANQADDAREEINAWVEQQTQQRIKDLVPPGSISALTRMVIANAVYFKEAWQQTFDPQKTARRPFTTPNRNNIYVNMMTTKGRFLYGKSEELNCYALELPYAGNALSMTILLPKNRYNGVSHLANSLTPDRLRDLTLDLYIREVQVSIPKFKIEDTFELSSALYRMGLRTLFDPRRVDLSGFTGNKEFKVDAVHHKTFIDVNEEGTEAAAASAIISSRNARPIGPASFIADYPFVYFIRDNLSNIILFFGTVQKPPEYENA